MQLADILFVFQAWDKKGRCFFTKKDLIKLLGLKNPASTTKIISRIVKHGFLQRAYRGVYVYPHAQSLNSHRIEYIAIALRRGFYNYISLESALAEYGVISQIPIDRLTIMTTGRSGTYKTIYGVIEFTHTQKSTSEILENVIRFEHRPLRMATKKQALKDLKRVGRNMSMTLEEEN